MSDQFAALRDIQAVTGPYETRPANPLSPDHGGTLDRAIVGRLADGRRVIIGEIWAAAPAEDGGRVSIDTGVVSRAIVEALNRREDEEATDE